MAENYNVQQIFADAGIITNTAAADAAEGERISALTRQGYGAVAAAGIPSAARNIGSSLGGMLGLDTRSKGEMLSEQLKGADLSTVEGINSAAGLIEKTHGGTAALGWKSQMLQRLGDTNRADFTANTARMNAQSSAQNADSSTGQLDLQTAQLSQKIAESDEDIRRYNLEATMPDVGEVKFADHTALSISQYQQAVTAAHKLTDEVAKRDALNQAATILRPKPKQDWQYKAVEGETDANGNQKYLLEPAGAELVRMGEVLRTKNTAGSQQREAAGGVVRKIDKMVDDLQSGKIDTGLWGILKSELAVGSDEYAFKGDLSVVLANLGYGGLMDAKNASATGASGFGQLTQKELELLQQLDEDLKIGLDEETLAYRLEEVQRAFEFKQLSAKSDWTMPQLLGHEDVPVYEGGVEGEAPPEKGDEADGANGELYIFDGTEWVEQ